MDFGISVHQNGYLERSGTEQRVNTHQGRSASRKSATFSRARIRVEIERTYCFTAVCDETRRLLEGFFEVVLESLVLVFLGA